MPLDAGALPFADLPNRAAAAHLLDNLDLTCVPTPVGYRVLVLQYVRPERTTGGLIMPEVSKREDEYQGRVGIVLAMGPDAYKDTEKFPNGPWVSQGDWVAWPNMQATATKLAIKSPDGKDRVIFVLLPDDAFMARGVNPERLSA